MVLTDWMADAVASISSTSAITASLNGIETEQPRNPSARIPPIERPEKTPRLVTVLVTKPTAQMARKRARSRAAATWSPVGADGR